LAMRRAGAVCVDLYSALVYQGWTVARDINQGLVATLDCADSGARGFAAGR
jgi:dihydroorotate dehydrogenase